MAVKTAQLEKTARPDRQNRPPRWIVGLLAVVVVGLAIFAVGLYQLLATGPKPSTNQRLDLPATLDPNDWPMDGYNGGYSYFNPNFTAVTPENIAQFGLRWSFRGATGRGPISAPIVAGNTVYLNAPGSLIALNRQDGQTRWTHPYSGTNSTSPLAVGNYIFNLANDRLQAVAASDGKLVWEVAVGATVAAPLYQSGRLYLAITDPAAPRLLILEASTGQTLWQRPLAASSLSQTPPVMAGSFWLTNADGNLIKVGPDSSPNLINAFGEVGLSANESRLIARRSNADLLISSPNSPAARTYPVSQSTARDDTSPQPVALTANNLVNIENTPAGAGRLRGLSFDESGAANVRWLWDNPNRQSFTSVSVGGTLAFAGSSDGILYVLNSTDGRQLWQYPFLTAPAQRPVLAGDSVYVVGSDGTLFCLGLGVKPTAPNNLASTLYSYATSTPDENATVWRGTLDGKAAQKIEAITGKLTSAPQLSQDGHWLAYTQPSQPGQSSLFLLNLDDPAAKPQPLSDANSEARDVVWARDGQSLFWVSRKSNQIYQIKLSGNQAGMVQPYGTRLAANLQPTNLQPTADGSAIYYIGRDYSQPRFNSVLGRVRADDAPDAVPLMLAQLRDRPSLNSLALAPDGSYLVYTLENDGGEAWLNVTSTRGTFSHRLVRGRGPLAFSPDGAVLSYRDEKDSTHRLSLNLDGQGQPQNGAEPQALSVSLPTTTTGFTWVASAPSKLASVPSYQAFSRSPQDFKAGLKGKIAFEADRQLFLMQADGTEVTQLPTPAGSNRQPTLAPGGQQIAFVHQEGNGAPQLWLMNADGSGAKALTSGSNAAYDPAWSPDESSLAYTCEQGGQRQICRLQVKNPSNVKTLTKDGESWQPAWSAKGDYLVYITTQPMPTDAEANKLNGTTAKPVPVQKLWKADRDGANGVLLAYFWPHNGWQGVANPSISPDGNRLALTVWKKGDASQPAKLSTVVFDTTFYPPSLLPGATVCSGLQPRWLGLSDPPLGCLALPADSPNLTAPVDGFFQNSSVSGDIGRGSAYPGKSGTPVILLRRSDWPIVSFSWSAR